MYLIVSFSVVVIPCISVHGLSDGDQPLPSRSFYTSVFNQYHCVRSIQGVFTPCRTVKINRCRCVHSIEGGPNVVGLPKSCRAAGHYGISRPVWVLAGVKRYVIIRTRTLWPVARAAVVAECNLTGCDLYGIRWLG